MNMLWYVACHFLIPANHGECSYRNDFEQAMERLNALPEHACEICGDEMTSLRMLRHHVHTEHRFTLGGRRIWEQPVTKKLRLVAAEPTTSHYG